MSDREPDCHNQHDAPPLRRRVTNQCGACGKTTHTLYVRADTPASDVLVRQALENLLKAHNELGEFKHTDSDYLFEQLLGAVIKATDEANDVLLGKVMP